ncbi:MAG: excinuclease ABC subunit UvrC [Spirochaetes bacterium]|nr:excinuclease ABC subunit UvrC [Spirochaetota bacterium]
MPEGNPVHKKLKSLPPGPGVYLMKDVTGSIIYIGKASSIRKRVSSYFREHVTDPKTRILVKKIRDIEWILTDSELEALILESTLIKKHRPKFNVRLKDDKRYPYIAVTLGEDYPRVTYTRTMRSDGTRYFGPYADARAAKNTVDLINSIFKLKTCRRTLPLAGHERPCLNRQINRCAGVCQGILSREEYRAIVDNAISFLEGKIAPVVANLRELIREHSDRRDYEGAAELRDMLYDIQAVSEKQKVHVPVATDQDYIGVSVIDDEAVLVLFEFRAGVLLGRKIGICENAQYAGPGEIIGGFLRDHYDRSDVPHRIITAHEVPDHELLEAYLSGRSNRNVKIARSRTRDDHGVINLIQKNIDVISAERYAARVHRDVSSGLDELVKILSLEATPHIIECFDISNLGGSNAVASMVVFRDGRPDPSGYRRYKIRGYETPNDPGMIHEVVSRRMQHLVNEDLEMPDLVVVDGGRTQLSRAIEGVRNFSGCVRVISLAKRFEEIYTDPGSPPMRLFDSSPARAILTSLRDEAHRFALTYHRKLRESGTRKSALDDLPIGSAVKSALLAHFRSLQAIRNATLEELQSVPGIGAKTARKIAESLKGQPTP